MEPNARLSYDLNDNNFLWASASRAVRTPSRFEEDGLINLHSAAVDLQVAGNDQLASEENVRL